MDCPYCGTTVAIEKRLKSDIDSPALSRECPDCECELSKHDHRTEDARLLRK